MFSRRAARASSTSVTVPFALSSVHWFNLYRAEQYVCISTWGGHTRYPARFVLVPFNMEKELYDAEGEGREDGLFPVEAVSFSFLACLLIM